MADKAGKLRTRTKVFYGIGDLGNAVVNPAIQLLPDEVLHRRRPANQARRQGRGSQRCW